MHITPWTIIWLVILTTIVLFGSFAAHRIWMVRRLDYGRVLWSVAFFEIAAWFLVVLITQVAYLIGGLHFPACWPSFWPAALIFLAAMLISELRFEEDSAYRFAAIGFLVILICVMLVFEGFALAHAVEHAHLIQLQGTKASKP